MAAMTVVEGYAEHVMDAVGEQLDPGYAELRRRLERDRERRGPLDAIVSKLLGLDMKMSQYRRGKAFADAGRRSGRDPHPEPGLAPAREPARAAPRSTNRPPGSTAWGRSARTACWRCFASSGYTQ